MSLNSPNVPPDVSGKVVMSVAKWQTQLSPEDYNVARRASQSHALRRKLYIDLAIARHKRFFNALNGRLFNLIMGYPAREMNEFSRNSFGIHTDDPPSPTSAAARP